MVGAGPALFIARGNVYDFYHALVGHAGGADYAQCARLICSVTAYGALVM